MANSSWNDHGLTDRGENLRRVFLRPSAGRGQRKAPGPVAWLVVAAALFVYAAIGLGPAISAAAGHGTAGYFVAQNEVCQHSCLWKGEFELPDGQVTRVGVEYGGDESGMHAGTKVQALDTGAVFLVFARHGDNSWILNAVELAASILVIILSIRRLIKKRRVPGFLTDYDAGGV